MHKILITGGTLGLCVLAGCSSSRSTLLTRDESNTAWQQNKSKGIPITLKVPTHIQVTVIDKQYLQLVTDPLGVTKVERLALEVPVRLVKIDKHYTEKVFTVDFVRPAAGPFTMDVDFDAEKQYFEKVNNTLTDNTISEIGTLINTISPGGLFRTASAGGDAIESKLKEIESVVATELFEVDSPTLERDVQMFLECHLNKAHDAYVVPAPAKIIRESLRGDHNPQPILCPMNPAAIWNGGEYCPPN